MVAPELQRPIEQLEAAIESGLPSKIEGAYSHYEQDEPTKKYFKGVLDRADSIHVKIVFQNSNVTRNMAEVRYRMIIRLSARGSKIPSSEVTSTWRAALVRGGSNEPWQIKRLARLGLTPAQMQAGDGRRLTSSTTTYRDGVVRNSRTYSFRSGVVTVDTQAVRRKKKP
jgi:hypothetical protein